MDGRAYLLWGPSAPRSERWGSSRARFIACTSRRSGRLFVVNQGASLCGFMAGHRPMSQSSVSQGTARWTTARGSVFRFAGGAIGAVAQHQHGLINFAVDVDAVDVVFERSRSRLPRCGHRAQREPVARLEDVIRKGEGLRPLTGGEHVTHVDDDISNTDEDAAPQDVIHGDLVLVRSASGGRGTRRAESAPHAAGATGLVSI